MRDGRAVVAVPAREMSLDDASAQLAEMLRRCDALAAEWAQFGDEVRARVAREVESIGHTVDAAIARAALGATAVAVERAFADDLGARMTALAAELARLEGRARAAARAIADERRGDRTLLYAGLAGIVLANILLALVLLRAPAPPAPAPPEPVPPAATPLDPALVTGNAIATPALPAPTPEPIAVQAGPAERAAGAGPTAGSGSGSGSAAAATKPKPKGH